PLALSDFDNARRIAEEIGDLFRVYVAKCFEGHVRTMSGHPGPGRRLIEESLVLGEQIGSRFVLARQKSFLAAALLALGEVDGVGALVREAIPRGEGGEDRFPRGPAPRTLGEMLLRPDAASRPEGERLMRQAIDILQELGPRPELART